MAAVDHRESLRYGVKLIARTLDNHDFFQLGAVRGQQKVIGGKRANEVYWDFISCGTVCLVLKLLGLTNDSIRIPKLPLHR